MSAYAAAARPSTAPAGSYDHDPMDPMMQHDDTGGTPGAPSATMSVHEANRARKATEANAVAIENRIRFFRREEEKIWRDLEEVRRQAATIEEGRVRALEKKLADQTIQQARVMAFEENKKRAEKQRVATMEARKSVQSQHSHEKRAAGEEQRQQRKNLLNQKRLNEKQAALQNSERAVAIQRAQLEARMKANQQRSEKLQMMKEKQEQERLDAEASVRDVEQRLPALEAEEMKCIQRLQNSRIVTQSVLEELESSLGTRSSVTSLLRQKEKQREHLDEVQHTPRMDPNMTDGGFDMHDAAPASRRH